MKLRVILALLTATTFSSCKPRVFNEEGRTQNDFVDIDARSEAELTNKLIFADTDAYAKCVEIPTQGKNPSEFILSAIGRYAFNREVSKQPDFQVISLGELLALQLYTGSAYESMNKALVGSTQCGFLRPYANLMIQGLRRLPDYVGVVSSGAGATTRDIESTYVVGKEYFVNQLMSTSKLQFVAERFVGTSNSTDAGILYVIATTAGRDISALSHIESEQEVLMLPRARYDVTAVEKEQNRFVVRMRQKNAVTKLPPSSSPLPYALKEVMDLDTFKPGYSAAALAKVEASLTLPSSRPKDYTVDNNSNSLTVRNTLGEEIHCTKGPTPKCVLKMKTYVFKNFAVGVSQSRKVTALRSPAPAMQSLWDFLIVALVDADGRTPVYCSEIHDYVSDVESNSYYTCRFSAEPFTIAREER